ncbi:MAG: tetratricopeptide repeat protein [Treponema sp.]|nr:tetratricopeptide repeat protein [Treponema sp.]
MAAIIVSIFVFSQINRGAGNERRELLHVWNEGNYEMAYEISKNALIDRPLDYFLLTINGFSAYQMGVSQINNQSMLNFINICIFSLRKAIMQKEALKDGRLYYVLGKAYGNKGAEYADLAVKYLNMANALNYDAQDIPEYLGLAYAAFGDYRNSVISFTQALIPGKPVSDNLLLSIARSYMAMDEYSMALGYLQRCIETSPDSMSVITARLLLAEIHKKNNDYDSAESQYNRILETSGENAEVRFQLGELYNMKGDTTRARSEWRMAFRQDPSHARARARLN